MAITDLIPWLQRRDQADEMSHPFLTLHREMNRLFDDVFRGFNAGPLGERFAIRWPSIEVSETDKEVKVNAELPGLEEKDIEVQFVNGALVIKGEKKAETDDKNRRFSERYYGRFERRVSVDKVDEDKATASFRNGVLTVTIPRVATAEETLKRIAINK